MMQSFGKKWTYSSSFFSSGRIQSVYFFLRGVNYFLVQWWVRPAAGTAKVVQERSCYKFCSINNYAPFAWFLWVFWSQEWTSIHLGFFLSCLQMTESLLCDPEGFTIQQWSESAKTVLSCSKWADCGYSETPQLQKAKCLHCWLLEPRGEELALW